MTSPPDLTRDVRDRLVRRFRRFADEEAPAVGSPLYARLADGITRHDELLAVLAGAPERQQRPTTLFAAVHDVLLRGTDHPLREHYPRLATRPADTPASDPVDDLLDLVRRHGDELRRLTATRGTQTNEVLRAVALAPALAELAHAVARPLALLEVGPSAGLLLQLDRYGYRYVAADGTETAVAGELELTTEVRNGHTPPAHLLPPPIVDRVGLDHAPLDVTDEDDVRWLRACIWPEHRERADRLDAALALARHAPPPIRAGDMFDDLAAAAAELDPDAHLVITHCVALMYLPSARRQAWRDHVAELSRERPVDVVAFEDHRIEPYAECFPADLAGDDAVHGVVARSSYRAGEVTHTLLGRAHMHGRWVGWA